MLDSCGVGHLGSHLMIAGVDPVDILEITNDEPDVTLRLLDRLLRRDLAAIFTISYDFGQKLLGLPSRKKEFPAPPEPDVYVSLFDSIIVHDYNSGETRCSGDRDVFDSLSADPVPLERESPCDRVGARVTSNFTKAEYLSAVEAIKERIRAGDTYQTNLTQQLSVELPGGMTPESVFLSLRTDHPAPFAAYIKRSDSTVLSASPERFFRVMKENGAAGVIEASPIKGTRRRGPTEKEDAALHNDLVTSKKDRAENTMIVDLLRNDIGRICRFGTVKVEKLCDLEAHPTLFHLVSTIRGELRDDVKFSEILRAVFPCGSITGAPKISTMRIIDEVETVNRGLSMGSIGYFVPSAMSGAKTAILDLNVAIRTMVLCKNVATFNVGGGITIDSDPESEYDETLLKAKALLNALGHPGTI